VVGEDRRHVDEGDGGGGEGVEPVEETVAPRACQQLAGPQVRTEGGNESKALIVDTPGDPADVGDVARQIFEDAVPLGEAEALGERGTVQVEVDQIDLEIGETR